MTTAGWYILANNEQTGPLSEKCVQTLLEGGAISEQTSVWMDGMSGWTALGEVGFIGSPRKGDSASDDEAVNPEEAGGNRQALWYLDSAGTKQGPFDDRDFRVLARSSWITEKTLIWSEAMESWTPAGESGLFRWTDFLPPRRKKNAASTGGLKKSLGNAAEVAGKAGKKLATAAASAGKTAKDTTGRAATRLWKSRTKARALIGKTLKSTGEVISPSDNVPDQSPEAPPGPKRPAESAPSPSPGGLATSSPPAQPVIRKKPPDQLAHVPEDTGLSVRADAIGRPLPAVEPMVTAVPASLPDQRALDLHHLKLLSYFYYATSGLWLVSMTLALPGAFVGSLGLGLWNLFMGSLNSFIGGCVASTVYSVMMPILLIFGGRFLARQQRYSFCILVAVLACFSLALSTILGIASLIVLFRPTVRGLFSEAKSRAAEAALPVAATASLGESNTTEAELMAKWPPGSDSGDC